MAFCEYLRKRDRTSVYVTVLFLCLLSNQLITSMAEFIPEFARIYDDAYRNMPVFNTVFSTVTAICLLNLTYSLTPDKKNVPGEYIILLGFILILLVIPTLMNNPVNLFLYSAVFPLYLFFRGIVFCRLLHKKSPLLSQGLSCDAYHMISFAAVFFPLTGLMENFVKIFFHSPQSGIYSHRIFSLDFLFGLAAASGIYAFMQKKTAPKRREAAARSQIAEKVSCTESGEEMEVFHAFCEAYGLTPREQTILSELLDQAACPQISDKQTHIHKSHKQPHSD